ncbi:MAG: T9SS type A sorting domain-containing protein [Draconibacterium sp.]
MIVGVFFVQQIGAQTAVAPSVGDGFSEVTAYEISTWENLYWISQNASEWDKYYIQTADIDFADADPAITTWDASQGWPLIGSYTDYYTNTPFTGTYNGNGHTVSGLYINRPHVDGVGLFAYTEGATIIDLGLKDVSIAADELAGALVGRTNLSTAISNCFSSGSISSGSYYGNIGGLVGYLSASSAMLNCYSSVSVTGTRLGGTQNLGGLIGGTHSATVTNCYSTGLVTGGITYVGGLIAYTVATTINNCFWDTETSGQETSSGGGTGKTTAEMQVASLYLEAGWDLMDESENGDDDLWGLNSSENGGYPFLSWQGYTNDAELALSTDSITSISTSTLTATCNGTIYTLGTPAPTQYGICWNTTGTPTLSDYYTEEGTPSAGVFSSNLTGLSANTVYYVRTYATNSSGTTYGNEISFFMIEAIAPPAGNGTSSNPYEIANLENLLWLSENSNEWDKYYIQTADIDASATSSLNEGLGFVPIGNWDTMFTGHYNGQFHIINGLYINRPSTDYNGLWGAIGTATIQNVGVTNAAVTGKYAGVLVGVAYSSYASIENCYCTGTVTGVQSYTGGLAGWFAYGTMKNCYSNVTVIGTSYSGGLIGRIQGGKVSNCYSVGNVSKNASTSSMTYLGGFAGAIDISGATVTNCYSTGSVSSSANSFGGFAAYYNSATVNGCFWDTQTSGQTTSTVGTGKTTSEMQTAGTYISAGWNFAVGNNLWALNGTDNNGYPFLRWQDFNPGNIWLGNSSTEWETALNWSENRVPSDTIIIATATNSPEISTVITVDSLIVETDACLTIKPLAGLTVAGKLINYADFAGLFIKSDATGTGQLINRTPGIQATVERYFTGNAWHMVSSPTSGGTISSFLLSNANIPVNGDSRGMMDYDEPSNDWNDFFTDAESENLTAGKGFALRTDADGVVTYTGTLASGTVSPTVARTGDYGWNCVGNPYPSTIFINNAADADYNFIDLNADNLDGSYGAIYVWEETNGDYSIVSLDDTEAFYAQVSQGFFVKVKTGATQVQFTTDMQTHRADAPFKSGTVQFPELKLTASMEGTNRMARIKFNDETTTGLDFGYDAGVFKTGFDIYTKLVEDNGVDFGVQSLPETGIEQYEIQVGLDVKSGGEISFSLEQENFVVGVIPVLTDNQTGTSFVFNNKEDVYTTFVNTEANGYGRFTLTFSGATGINDILNSQPHFRAWYSNGVVTIAGEITGEGEAEVYDGQGRKLASQKLENINQNRIEVPTTTNGIYLIRVKDLNRSEMMKVVKTGR